MSKKRIDYIVESLRRKNYWVCRERKTKHLAEEENFEIIYDEILERGGEKQYWIIARKNG